MIHASLFITTLINGNAKVLKLHFFIKGNLEDFLNLSMLHYDSELLTLVSGRNQFLIYFHPHSMSEFSKLDHIFFDFLSMSLFMKNIFR